MAEKKSINPEPLVLRISPNGHERLVMSGGLDREEYEWALDYRLERITQLAGRLREALLTADYDRVTDTIAAGVFTQELSIELDDLTEEALSLFNELRFSRHHDSTEDAA